MKKVLLALLLCTASLARTVHVGQDNYFLFRGEVDDGMSDAVEMFISQVNASKQKEAIFIINSPGGSVLAGGIIVDAIKASKIPTICVVHGMAASMAAMTLENCTKRYATTNSIVMFHGASGGLQGDLENMKSRVAGLDRLITLLDVIAAARMQITLERYKSMTAHELWLMGAQEALKYHAIDEEVTLEVEPPKPKLPELPLPIHTGEEGKTEKAKQDNKFKYNEYLDFNVNQSEVVDTIKNFKLE